MDCAKCSFTSLEGITILAYSSYCLPSLFGDNAAVFYHFFNFKVYAKR